MIELCFIDSNHASACRQLHLTESVHKVVLQKSILAQIRQLMLFISKDEGRDDGFGRKLFFCKTPLCTLYVR